MKRQLLQWLFAAVLLHVCAAAKGDIMVTFTLEAGTGENAGYDIIRYFATFHPESFLGRPDNPSTPEREGWGATGLQSISVTLQLAAPEFFKFRFVDENGDGFADADTDSSTVANRTTSASNATLGTHVRIGPIGAGAWTPVLVEPAGETSVTDPTTGELAAPAPETTYAAVKQFRIEGANPNAPDLSARTVDIWTPNAGALFAVAVVPPGAFPRVIGQIAADKGPIEYFELSRIPEPAGAGVLGLLVLTLRGRRSIRQTWKYAMS